MYDKARALYELAGKSALRLSRKDAEPRKAPERVEAVAESACATPHELRGVRWVAGALLLGGLVVLAAAGWSVRFALEPARLKREFAGISFVWIDPGCFAMGSPANEIRHEGDEIAHAVAFTKGVWMGRFEVTNAQFARFTGATGYVTDAEREGWGFAILDCAGGRKEGVTWRDPGWVPESDEPVVLVSWNDAQAYVAWLNTLGEGRFRLPTEAEWEYAARAGQSAPYLWGDDPGNGRGWCNAADRSAKSVLPPDRVTSAWNDGYARTAPVGSFRPNEWGIYDIAGNVFEWCEDRYGAYPGEDAIDPKGPGESEGRGSAAAFQPWRTSADSKGREAGEERTCRGGSWTASPDLCRCCDRWSRPADSRDAGLGFRVCRD